MIHNGTKRIKFGLFKLKMKNKNLNNNNIIFIVSQPRSGSTFLQNSSNHSQITTSAEPGFFANF